MRTPLGTEPPSVLDGKLGQPLRTPKTVQDGVRQTPVFRTLVRPGTNPFPEAAIFVRKSLSLCTSARQCRIRGLPHMLVEAGAALACYCLPASPHPRAAARP